MDLFNLSLFIRKVHPKPCNGLRMESQRNARQPSNDPGRVTVMMIIGRKRIACKNRFSEEAGGAGSKDRGGAGENLDQEGLLFRNNLVGVGKQNRGKTKHGPIPQRLQIPMGGRVNFRRGNDHIRFSGLEGSEEGRQTSGPNRVPDGADINKSPLRSGQTRVPCRVKTPGPKQNLAAQLPGGLLGGLARSVRTFGNYPNKLLHQCGKGRKRIKMLLQAGRRLVNGNNYANRKSTLAQVYDITSKLPLPSNGNSPGFPPGEAEPNPDDN